MTAVPVETNATFFPLLGTDVSIRVVAADHDAGQACEEAAVGTLQHLQGVFSVFEPDSELSRWRRGEVDAGPELVSVLTLAHRWHALSRRAFHPAALRLRRRWLRAEQDDDAPARREMAELAAGIAELPFHPTREGGIIRVADCADVDLNAIAKGWAVDRATEAGLAVAGVHAVTVNAGGDLRHRGSGGVTVGIEDPARPVDNAPPLARVRVRNAGLATSGAARRGFRVRGQWYGQVLDPRTGWPVAHTRSVSVLAPDAATADAVATCAGVLPLAEGLRLVGELGGVDFFLIDGDGRRHRTPGWPEA